MLLGFVDALGLLWGRFGAALGPLWGCFGTTLEMLWGYFGGASGALQGRFRYALGTLRGHFILASGRVRGRFGAALIPLWGCFGVAWGALLGRFGYALGTLRGGFRAALGLLWADLWLLWARFGTALAFGAALGVLWGRFGPLALCGSDPLGPWPFGALGLFIQHCFWALPFREPIPAAGTEGSSVLFIGTVISVGKGEKQISLLTYRKSTSSFSQ